MLAYVGAEDVAPILSAVAAVVGFLLICWRWTTTQCRRIYRLVFRIKVDDSIDDDGPELGEGDSDVDRTEPQKLQQTGS